MESRCPLRDGMTPEEEEEYQRFLERFEEIEDEMMVAILGGTPSNAPHVEAAEIPF
jgi:hypothetical protein